MLRISGQKDLKRKGLEREMNLKRNGLEEKWT